MSTSNIIIFYPKSLKTEKIGLLQGVTIKLEGDLIIYITNPDVVVSGDHIVGYCSDNTPDETTAISPERDKAEFIHVNTSTKEFTLYNVNLEEYDENFLCVSYDLNTMSKCDTVMFDSLNYGDHIKVLHEIIRSKEKNEDFKGFLYIFFELFIQILGYLLNFLDKIDVITKYSTTIMHLKLSFGTLKKVLDEKPRISVKNMNVFSSKLIDFFVGYLFLYVFFKYESIIFHNLNNTIEVIIENLKTLLVFLRGSPIGLKLNHNFNITLNSFFFYHIFLWKTFVEFIKPHLYSIFYILLVPCGFGVSYQAAVIEDLIKFCTVHVYCIYNYAARLYGIQIYALIALWRLFIGRKYNPLRNRVDSYQYNHNQLFIGTLTFTILLFLLPTTLLYYVVFTTFRLFLKSLNYLLSSIRILLQHLPVYSLILWIFKSPKVSGLIILTSSELKSPENFLHLHLNLKILPLKDCIIKTLPKTTFTIPKINFKEGLNKVFTGKLL